MKEGMGNYGKYVNQLPDLLDIWYDWTPDGGHSIEVVLKRDGDKVPSLPAKSVERLLVHVPVMTVLRGYRVVKCADNEGFGYGYFVVSDHAVYDKELGVVSPAEDIEY